MSEFNIRRDLRYSLSYKFNNNLLLILHDISYGYESSLSRNIISLLRITFRDMLATNKNNLKHDLKYVIQEKIKNE